jgi:predicted flap endonuclease-1-like 5' DNA nuclease
MTSFLAGLALIIVGLVSALFGYRLFRILLPVYGAIFGFVTAWGWWGESAWLLALIAGVVFAVILGALAYGLWSVFVGIAGVVAGLALAGIIATSFNMATWLAVVLALVLASAFAYLFVKIRNPAVILITAVDGAAAVALGVGEWFGLQAGFGTAVNPGWLLVLVAAVFVIVGAAGLAFQWNKYRHLNLYGEPEAAKAPASSAPATRATSVPVSTGVASGGTAAVAAPAAVAVAGAAVVAAEKHAEPEPVAAEGGETPVVEAPVAAVAVAEAAEARGEEVAVAAPVEAAAEGGEAPVVEAPVAAVAVAEGGEARGEEVAVAAPVEAAATAAEAPVAAVAVAGAAVANKVEDALPAEEADQTASDAAGAVDANTVDEVVSEIEQTYSYDDIAKFKEKLEYVEGIGPAYAEKLQAVGINNVLDLLHRGATRKGRLELVEATGITGKLILRWVNHADLYRVKGVGSEYADLLEVAGVDTVVELSKRNPANLLNAMTETNKVRKLVRKEPVASQVEDWVSQAKKLPRVIQY